MAGDAEVPRRWQLLDAIFLIAATAVAIMPTKELLPEVIPVVRQVDLFSIRDYPYHVPLFSVPMRSARDRFRSYPVLQARLADDGLLAAEMDLHRPQDPKAGVC